MIVHLHLRLLCLLSGMATFSAPLWSRAEVYVRRDGRLFNTAAPADTFRAAIALQAASERLAPCTQALTGAYCQPTMGTQLHSSCFRPEVIPPGVTPEQLRSGFDRLVEETVQDVLACVERYPELRPYLSRWITQVRGATIGCTTTPDSPQHNWGAFHPSNRSQIALLVLPHEVSLYADMPVDDAGHRPAAIFKKAYLSQFASGAPSSYARSLLLHEILHSVNADNRNDHNSIEHEPFDTHGACGDNILVDRVNIVAMLCTGDSLYGQVPPASASGAPSTLIAGRPARPVAQAIARRISLCGMDRGCREIFAQTPNTELRDEANVFRGYDLSPDAAMSLCSRIEEDGVCLNVRNRHEQARIEGGTQPWFSDYAWIEPHLAAFRPRLEARLNQVLPGHRNVLPKGLLDLIPDSANLISSLSSDRCFNSIFAVRPDGSLLIRPSILRHCRGGALLREVSCPTADIFASPIDGESPARHFGSLGVSSADYVGDMASVVYAATESAPECAVPMTTTPRDPRLRRNALINRLAQTAFQRLREGEREPLVMAAMRRIAGSDEGRWLPFDGAPSSYSGSLLGEGLASEYRAALERYHPRSDTFDCRSITPLRAVNMVGLGIPAPRPQACPQ